MREKEMPGTYTPVKEVGEAVWKSEWRAQVRSGGKRLRWCG